MFEWLNHTAYADWVRESWGWALALTIHAFGNATVVGLTLIMGLRVFGFFKSMPHTALVKFFPFVWTGIGLQVVSGVTLWMSKPPAYVKDWVFDTKFTLVVIGIFVLTSFQKVLTQEAGSWQAESKVSARGVRVAAAACLVWAFVIIMGRLTAYLGSLYIA